MRKVFDNFGVSVVGIVVFAGIIFAMTFFPGEDIRKVFWPYLIVFLAGVVYSHVIQLIRVRRESPKRKRCVEDEDE